MLFSLLAHVLAAIVSTGYHHADEHFQILEPLGWKLGFYGPQDLAWEFTEQIRPGLQIGLGYGIAKILLWLGVYNPFTLTATLRQLTGVLWWALTWAFYKKWSKEFSQPFQVKTLLIFSVLLWFLPYLHVRYSSESWGGLLFFFGLYVCLYTRWQPFAKHLLGGVLMGLAFCFRFQMGFAIAGFLAWLFFSRNMNAKTFLGLLIGGGFAAMAGVLSDYWLYGEWVISPYNYFYQNIVAGKAAGFGVSPFYAYITMFIERVVPPVSIVLLALLVLGCIKAWRSPWVWILVAFVLAHSVVGHKEFRFMFPMVALLPLLLTCGLQKLVEWVRKLNAKTLAYSLRAFVTLNVVLMGLSLLKPASGREALFKAFYMVHSDKHTAKIAFVEKDPFDNGLQMNFFRYCKDCFYEWKEPLGKQEQLYIYTYKINGLPDGEGLTASLKYSTAPIVAEPLNFGHWQERTNHGYFWEIKHER